MVGTIVGIVLVVVLLLMAISFGRSLWRHGHDNEELVPGGSDGRQLSRRAKDARPDGRR